MYHLSLLDTLILRIKIICLVYFTVWHVNTSTTDYIHILCILSKIDDHVGKGKHFFFIFEIFHVYHSKQQKRGIHLRHNISTYTAKQKNRRQLNRACMVFFTSKLQWGFQLGPNCFHHKVSSMLRNGGWSIRVLLPKYNF